MKSLSQAGQLFHDAGGGAVRQSWRLIELVTLLTRQGMGLKAQDTKMNPM